MAELCLLAPIMILMWIGIDYFRSGYARRLNALAISHAQAWKLAYSNDGSCFKSGLGGAWQGLTGGNPELETASAGEKGGEAAEAFKGGTSSSLFMYGHAYVTGQQKSTAAHWIGGEGGKSLEGSTFITCNEVVPATNAESGVGSTGTPDKYADQDVIKPLWEFIRSLF
jgi:hypothetical protein